MTASGTIIILIGDRFLGNSLRNTNFQIVTGRMSILLYNPYKQLAVLTIL